MDSDYRLSERCGVKNTRTGASAQKSKTALTLSQEQLVVCSSLYLDTACNASQTDVSDAHKEHLHSQTELQLRAPDINRYNAG